LNTYGYNANNNAAFRTFPFSQRRSGAQCDPSNPHPSPPPQANGVNITINYPQATVSNDGASSAPPSVTGGVPNQSDTFNRQQDASLSGANSHSNTPLGLNGQPLSGAAAASGSSVNTLSTSVNPSTETPQGHLIQIYDRLNEAYKQASAAQQNYLQLRDNYLNQADAYTQLAKQMNDQAYGQYNGQAGAQGQALLQPQTPQAALLPAFDPTQQQALQQGQAVSPLMTMSQGQTNPNASPSANPAMANPQALTPEQLKQMLQDPAIQAQAMQLAQKVDPAQLQAMLQDPSVQQLLQQVGGVPASTGTTGALPNLSSRPTAGAPQNNGGPAGLPPQGFMA
jgi:hypothetical protein